MLLRRAGHLLRAAMRPRRYPTVFVANDAVLPQTLAFLESVVTNAPQLDLICIPYDGAKAGITALRRHYTFEIASVDIGPAMAALSTELYGRVVRRLVKLSCFDLPLDEFLLLDTDVIVLQDLRPLFGLVSNRAKVVFADESRTQCYTSRDDGRLAVSREFNTGAFLSSQRFLSVDDIVRAVRANLAVYRAVGFLQNDDQPMLNFAVDMLGIPVRDYAELGCRYSADTWFLKDNLAQVAGGVTDTLTGRPVPLIHFAGQSHAGLENAPRFAELYGRYLALGQRRIGA
jgi:hypothetical protein